MKYINRYRLKGILNENVYFTSINKPVIRYNGDYIEIEYDREFKQYLLFGKKVIVHFERVFTKHELVEFSFRESIQDKSKDVIEVIQK